MGGEYQNFATSTNKTTAMVNGMIECCKIASCFSSLRETERILQFSTLQDISV
jgi:hypothetical protein